MNQNLGKTQITNNVRVSSACIFLHAFESGYFQYETWVFVEGGRSRQIIVGSAHSYNERLASITKRLHNRVSKILKNKL